MADGRRRRRSPCADDEKTAYVSSAAWPPDGDFLVARKQDAKPAGMPPNELWLYHRLGGTGVKLTAADELAPRVRTGRFA